MSNKINPYSPSDSYENSNMANSYHQRPHEMNQQLGVATRPQLPRDVTGHQVNWQPGTLPKGGYRSMFDFSGNEPLNTKKSPTRGGGRGVY